MTSRWPSIIRTAAERARNLKPNDVADIRGQRSRRFRSEICTALRHLTGALVECCDLATLTIGSRNEGGYFRARGVWELSQWADLRYRRTQRALAILCRAGLVTTIQRREKRPAGQGWRSSNAIRKLTREFWRTLNMELAIERERPKAIRRLREHQPRAAALAAATVRLHFRGRDHQPGGYAYGMETIEDAKAFSAIVVDLIRTRPDVPNEARVSLAREIWRSRK